MTLTSVPAPPASAAGDPLDVGLRQALDAVLAQITRLAPTTANVSNNAATVQALAQAAQALGLTAQAVAVAQATTRKVTTPEGTQP